MEASSATTVTVIEPRRGWHFPDLREVWRYRDLLYFLARRDVVIRYKQAVVGVFWAILQPVILAVVFSVFLGLVYDIPALEGIPVELFIVVGMVMWLAFANAIQNCTESTLASDALISKIYFPRLIIPLASVAPAAVDFIFGFIVVIVAAFAFGHPPGIEVLAVPLTLILAIACALGFGLWLSALNVKYRDVHLVVPLIILTGLFVTPVLYPLDALPPTAQDIALLNPLVGVLEAWRWAILGTDWPGLLLAVPLATTVILLVTGSLYFERSQRTFADVI